MKITCESSKLAEALQKVSRAVPSQSAIKETTGVKVTAAEGKVTLTGYDLTMGIVCEIDAEVSQSGSIIIPSPFNDIVRKVTGQTVTITADESNMVYIDSGNAKFNLFGYPADNYPELPVFANNVMLELPQAVLRRLVRQSVFAVAVVEGKPVQQGVLFEIENNVLTLAALDGYRMAVSSENIEYDGDAKFVVPGKTLNELLRMLDEVGVVKICAGKTHAMFFVDDCKIYTRLITQGEFVMYRNIIPTSCNTTVRINTRAFIESVEKVALLVDSQMAKKVKSSIIVKFGDNETSLSCSTLAGKAEDKIDCKTTGAEMEVGINNIFILDALRAADCDEVVIKLTSAFAAIRVTPPEGDNFTFLIMPVRTRSDD